MAGNSGAIRAGAAYVEIFADKSKLMRGLKAAEQSIKQWGTSISSLGKKMMGLGMAIVAPLVTLSAKTAAFAHEIEEMSLKTGAGIESLQGLSYAADQNEVSMEGLTRAFTFMHKNLFSVYKGTKQVSQSFAALGLTAKDLIDKSPEEQFMLIADKIASIKDPTARAALALKVFGRSGVSLLPMLSKGAEGLRAYQAELQRLGAVMSKEDVEVSALFYKELKKMWYVIKNGLANAIGSALIPILTSYAKKMIEVVGAATRWVKENRGVVTMAFWLGVAITAAGAALYAFGTAVIWLSKVIGAVHAALGVMRTLLTFLISPIGMVTAAVVAATGAFLYFTGYGGQLLNWLGGCFNTLKKDATAALDGISNAMAKGDMGLAAKIGWTFVKMEWLKAKQWLLEIWYGVKFKLLSVWYGVVYGLVDAWNTAVYGIQVAWIETVSFLKRVWVGFKSFWGQTVDWVAKKLFGVWVWWQKLNDPNFDGASAQKAFDQQLAADKQNRDEQSMAEMNQIENERKKRRDSARGEYDALSDAAEQAQYDELKSVSEESANNLRTVGEELKKAKDDFNSSVKEANAPEKKTAPVKRPAMRGINWQSGMDKASSTGTFSAFGLSQIGAGSVMQKIADFTQRTAEATEELADKMDGGEPEFGA
jgi:hypothetical protein